MNLRSAAPRGPTNPANPSEPAPANPDRILTMLIEGAAKNTPEIDLDAYKALRAKVSGIALQMPDRLPDEDKLALIRKVLHEFQVYKDVSSAEIRTRQTSWRGLVERLLRETLANLGIDASSPEAFPLIERIVQLTTAGEIDNYRATLDDFLHPGGSARAIDIASPLKIADRTTANDNAAGLRGGGSAVEYLSRLMVLGSNGFIALFRLSCLDVISDRFGMEAVQDCLMAVSAYLTHSLHGNDRVYHWSDSSLMAILEKRSNEQVLAIELRRIAANNRDIAIQVGGRTIMLRVPLEFDITPINRLRSADELYKLSPEQVTSR